MRRQLRIYRVFLVSSFNRELEFRANFAAKVLQNAMWIAFGLAMVLIIFSNTKSLAGWTQADVLVLTGTAALMSASASGLFFSLNEIPAQVRQGTLDFVVTKPVSSQFWISFRKVNFDQIGPFLFGLCMVIYGFHASHAPLTLGGVLGWAVLGVCALAVFYSLSLSLMTLAVWLVRVDNLWVLTETAANVSRTPVDVYPGSVRQFLLYFVPLALLASIPAKTLLHGPHLEWMAVGLSWAVGGVIASRAFWLYATKHYASASS